MFQIDSLTQSLSKYKQFPQREPLRRNYQTCKVNPFSKRSLDITSISPNKIETQVKIPLNFSKLYQKQTKNIIIKQSQSNQSRISQALVIMKTINIRNLSTESNRTQFSNITQQKTVPLDFDSSGSSDFHELRKIYLKKYCKPSQNQRLPRFQMHSIHTDTLDPWLVDE